MFTLATRTRMIWNRLWLEDFDEEKENERFNMGFCKENLKGFVLALLSSGFIGASFIIKKKGLRRAAAASGVRAGEILFHFFVSIYIFFNGFWFVWIDMYLIPECLGVGGYSYLLEPLWWLGMITSKSLHFVRIFWFYVLIVLRTVVFTKEDKTVFSTWARMYHFSWFRITGYI